MVKHCTQCGEAQDDDARFCPRCGTPTLKNAPVPVENDPLLGQVISDRYLLVEKIGRGASGTIYRAEHTTLRKKVAVKVLHPQLSRDDTALERFRREATTVGELDNDHILSVIDFGRADAERLFFAMEYLDGLPLSTVVDREKQLAVPRVVDILTQVSEALVEAHGLGYIHRDLRPRNVFLITRRGRADFVKLLDFGLSKLILPDMEAKQTAMGMTFGDPRYMSPEQARGDTLDRRADIYSLGAVAYEALTGVPPYSGGGTFEILKQHLDAPVPHPRDRRPDCPAWLGRAGAQGAGQEDRRPLRHRAQVLGVPARAEGSGQLRRRCRREGGARVVERQRDFVGSNPSPVAPAVVVSTPAPVAAAPVAAAPAPVVAAKLPEPAKKPVEPAKQPVEPVKKETLFLTSTPRATATAQKEKEKDNKKKKKDKRREETQPAQATGALGLGRDEINSAAGRAARSRAVGGGGVDARAGAAAAAGLGDQWQQRRASHDRRRASRAASGRAVGGRAACSPAAAARSAGPARAFGRVARAGVQVATRAGSDLLRRPRR